MKHLLLLLALVGLCGCGAPQRKPCQVERIGFAYAEVLTNHPAMMMDILHTIAVLENETGHYQ